MVVSAPIGLRKWYIYQSWSNSQHCPGETLLVSFHPQQGRTPLSLRDQNGRGGVDILLTKVVAWSAHSSFRKREGRLPSAAANLEHLQPAPNHGRRSVLRGVHEGESLPLLNTVGVGQ